MRITYQEIVSQPIDSHTLRSFILKNRLIKDPDSFYNPPLPSTITLQSLGFEKELQKTIKLLNRIKKAKGTIVVYTDYDADGITGGAIVWETLHALGFHVMPYVPDRISEGYGFSEIGIDKVIEKYKPSLIISVDHGISGRKQITYAKQKGVQVIVTDHHTKPDHIPEDAEVIFHIPLLSGSGVAYVFAKAIAEYFGMDHRLQQNFETDFLAFAAIGTIADLVPLIGPSRSIVKHGLKTFSYIKKPGIRYILQNAGIAIQPLTPYHIGFIVAPRINAAGRIRDAMDALRLLCTNNDQKAQELASLVNSTNVQRQSLVEESVVQAIEMVKIQYSKGLSPLIILKSDVWHEGIIGLIASKLVEMYYHPTIILTKGEKGYKASARSIPSFHLAAFLAQHKDFLFSYGGHAGAAGFSIDSEKIKAFIKEAQKNAALLLKKEDFEKNIIVDIRMPFSLATLSFYKLLAEMEPFGMGNQKPLFASDIVILNVAVIGKQKNHLRLTGTDPDFPSTSIDLMAFGKAQEYLPKLTNIKRVHVIYELDSNTWNGYTKAQAIVRHIIFI